MLSGPTVQQKGVTLQFKVASYNIHKAIGSDRRRSPERIMAVLAEVGADVVVLQEADRRFGARQSVLPAALIAAHSTYCPVVFDTRPGSLGWHGNAMLVRRHIVVSSTTTISLPSLEPRGSVVAELTIDRHRLRIVGMHLDLTGLRRREQARSIVGTANRLPPLPTIIMGDTNEWRPEGGCMPDFHVRFTSAPTGPSFPAGRPMLRLDRILVGDGFDVVAAGSHHTKLAQQASDHLPVWAQLAFRAPQ